MAMFTKGKYRIPFLFIFYKFSDLSFDSISFYKKTGEIVAIKMIDLDAELLHDE